MLRIPGKIPVSISPFFWVMAALIGYLNSIGSSNIFLSVIIWIIVIFISILVHEFGHALTSLYFKQSPSIQLVAFGGMTIPEGKRLKGWREFLVVLNGPVFGFVLFLIALGLMKTGFFKAPALVYALMILMWVNLFWTAVNLLPIMPLDGGQLLRVIFESIFKSKGLKYAVFSSMLFSAIGSVVFFFIGFFLIGAIFFLFAFQNFDAYRKMKVMTPSDQDEGLEKELKDVEELLSQGHEDQALPRLETIRVRSKKGMIFNLSTEYLAFLKYAKQDYRSVYDLLAPIKQYLSAEARLNLHHAAYQVKDYSLVIELATSCFRMHEDASIALRTAEASAALKQVDATIGWLQAARRCGLHDLDNFLNKEIFQEVKHLPAFQKFLSTYK